MIQVRHKLSESPHKNISMLLPIGAAMNRDIIEAEVGQRLEFLDGGIAELVYVCTIRMGSEEAMSLSWLIYDLPIEDVFHMMWKNWKYEVSKYEIIHLVVKKIKDGEMYDI